MEFMGPRTIASVIFLASMGLSIAPGDAPAACATIGGTPVCDGDVSHAEVGRQVIFPHGPAGERAGDFLIRPKGTLPQVLPKVLPRGTGSAPPGPRPLDRPDGLTDPRRGEDFGAFEFRSPPPAGLPSTGPLR